MMAVLVNENQEFKLKMSKMEQDHMLELKRINSKMARMEENHQAELQSIWAQMSLLSAQVQGRNQPKISNRAGQSSKSGLKENLKEHFLRR
jgi:hypothetical protein